MGKAHRREQAGHDSIDAPLKIASIGTPNAAANFSALDAGADVSGRLTNFQNLISQGQVIVV
jgi:hypothetical protein